jgi:MoaD family protein
LQFLIIGGCALQVSVRFFTSLRELTGKREEILKFQNGETVTVNAVLKRLSKRYGKNFIEYVYDRKTGEVKGFLQLLVNGQSTSSLGGLNTKLVNGDVLAIIPPVGGG